MSDLATIANHLARSNAQLPVSVYFDESLMQQEIQQLFRQGPRYVGHELMVPNVGDFATLASENEGRMLVRNPQGIELLSNVCRHRQAKMFNGRQFQQHRLPATSLDLRLERRADWRAAF